MKEQQAPTTLITRLKKHPLIVEIMIAVVVALAIGTVLLLHHMESRVYIENAQISTPIIAINAPAAGVLEEMKMSIGEEVHKGAVLATVSEEPVRALASGVIVYALDAPGETVGPQTTLVKMIDPSNFRVVGRVDEDKGLADIRPGQDVTFTVDAFPRKEYEGTVEVVTPTAHEDDVVFSISDKRPVQQYDVRVTFDASRYPELKNGMSAKMWIHK